MNTFQPLEILEKARLLPPEEQIEIAITLILSQWDTWQELSSKGQNAIRQLASQSGVDWDSLSDEERERLVDEILHED